MNYLVSYDLNKTGKDYPGVAQAIQQASTGDWCKPLESVWIIRSNLSPLEIRDSIQPYLDADDSVLVIEVTHNYSGFLDRRVVEYLNQMK